MPKPNRFTQTGPQAGRHGFLALGDKRHRAPAVTEARIQRSRLWICGKCYSKHFRAATRAGPSAPKSATWPPKTWPLTVAAAPATSFPMATAAGGLDWCCADGFEKRQGQAGGVTPAKISVGLAKFFCEGSVCPRRRSSCRARGRVVVGISE